MLGQDSEDRLCMVIIQVSCDTEVLYLVEVYLGDSLEMVGQSVGTKEGRDFAQSLLRSLRTDFFESGELYSEDGIEMAIQW